MIASHGMYGGLGGDWISPFGWLGGLLALLLTVAFWVVIAVVIVRLVKTRPVSIGTPSSAQRVLEERYARGEIERDEFLERRAVLAGESRPPTPSA